MRLAFVSTQPSAAWAASEFLWAETADLALRAGHEVLISAYDWGHVPAPLARLVERGAHLHRRRRPKLGRLERRIDQLTRRWRHLAAFKPDIVCVSQAASYDAFVAHDLVSLPAALYSLNKPYVLYCNALPEHWILSDEARGRGQRLFRAARGVVFVSERNRQIAERHLATAIPNSLLLHAPANISGPIPLPWPTEEKEWCMAIIGRLDAATKGHDVLLESLGAPAWRDRNWRLRIYGDGPDRRYLAQLAEHYGVADRVDFPGHVENLRDVWAANHLLVMTSRHESGPLVVIEAALYGRPMVATDVGLVSDWVEDGTTGFVAAATTRAELTEGLERAWAERERWSQMGIAAHAKGIALWERSPGEVMLRLMTDGLLAAASRTA
jgi:glycosyltransferase involved in cell wall biosynthesis